MIILAAVDLAVNLIIVVRRVPAVFLQDNWLLRTWFPLILLYVIPLEKGLLTLSSLVFIIYIGGRHLQTVRAKITNVQKLTRFEF